MADVRWLDDREARLWQAYRGLTRELQRAFERQLERDGGLSAAEYAVLAPVSEAEDGVIRMRDLGRQVDWDRSRLSHQVKRMEKRGLVVREDCVDDARGAMVRITPAGRDAIEAAAPEHVATVRRHFFDPLSERDQATLTRLFERLLDGLGPDAQPRAGTTAEGSKP